MHTRFVIAGLLTGAALTGYCAAQQKPVPTLNSKFLPFLLCGRTPPSRAFHDRCGRRTIVRLLVLD